MNRFALTILCAFLVAAHLAAAERRRGVSRPDRSRVERVEIIGWNDDAMEPFVSPDGQILFFNNSNDPEVNTDLQWATRQGDGNWLYQGPVVGVNTESLEAVPSLDETSTLYYVSTRTYQLTLSTIYRGKFDGGLVTDLELLDEISRRQPGWVNFDVEVTRDGQKLYFVDARFSPLGFPVTADLVIALNLGNRFARLVNSDEIMKNVNTAALEYAAAISADELTLYFTRALDASSTPGIWKATRAAIDQPFAAPTPVLDLDGFVEAPSFDENETHLYYHRRVEGRFVIERIRIPGSVTIP